MLACDCIHQNMNKNIDLQDYKFFVKCVSSNHLHYFICRNINLHIIIYVYADLYIYKSVYTIIGANPKS